MKASHQLPADAATRGTLFDRARTQGFAEDLTDRVFQAVKKQERKKRSVRRGIGALVLFVGLSIWAVPYFRSTDSISTHAAHRQTLTFNDGSRVDLNAQTQLKTDFRYGRRIVRLSKGEAFFNVAKDTAHPFLVETPSGTVLVTGTQFNVRLLSNSAMEVTLLEGSVGVQPASQDLQSASARLIPRQQFRSDDGSIHTLNASNLESVTAWREGRLILDEMTVGDAIDRIARYHGKKMDVSAEVASVRLGGSCPLDDFPALLRALQATRIIDITENADGSYRVRAHQL